MSNKPRWVRHLPIFVGVVLTTTVGSAAVYFIKQFIDSPPPQTKQVIQEVRLIRPPPPPPDLEPPPPPPPEVDEKVALPDPQPTPDAPSDQPPAGDLLGLDSEGVAGGDGFGLAARRGGRDLLASGGDRFAWYSGMLKQDLLTLLGDNRDIRARAYSVNVRLWLDAKGAVTRVALASSTGDHDVDRRLNDLLASMERVAEAPPEGLPQPVQIRIVSRL
jgi:periplasmic protein TonB